jgi:hypothetical protein
VLVDLAGLAVLAEETAENTLAPHPQDLGGHTGLSATLALTDTGVATLGLGGLVLASAGAGVNDLRLDDDETVLAKTTDVLPRVGVANLGEVTRVKIDLALANAEDGRGETLLGAKVGHGGLFEVVGGKGNEGSDPERVTTSVRGRRGWRVKFETKLASEVGRRTATAKNSIERAREAVGRVVGEL